MSVAYEGPKSELTDVLVIEAFIKALGVSKMAFKVRESEPANLDKAVRHAHRFESMLCVLRSEPTRVNEQGRYHYTGVQTETACLANVDVKAPTSPMTIDAEATHILSENEFRSLTNDFAAPCAMCH